MNEMQRYQSEHLFLLVGTNPLPNYVAANLLLKPNGHVYLVHTNETAEIADRLIKALGLEWGKAIKVSVEEAECDDIFDQVARYANSKQGLGLNYTGGTKAMAVHAYRAVERTCPNAIFSYLDAASLKMVIERHNQPRSEVSASLAVKPRIETLLAMHGYELKDKPDWEPFKPGVCRELINVPCAQLREWCNSHLRSDHEKELRPVELPIDHLFAGVARYWEGCKTLGELGARWEMKVGKLAKWLDGIWLEHYTLWALQQIAVGCQIHQAGVSFKPKERDFEFDVAAMRGYQLFALSCTTESRKGLVKSKLFEAYIRARQMGGDEARIGVVCCVSNDNPDSNPDRIQGEIEESWDAKGKVRVFGAEHLQDLPAYLQDWFSSQPQ